MSELPTHQAWAWLDDETWRWLTNVAGDREADQLKDLRARWGTENIRVSRSAYDADRNPISGRAVFVRRSELEARARR